MNITRRILALSLILAPVLFQACASVTGPGRRVSPYTTGDDCICGTSRGDRYGCYCEACLLHGGNPDNPDCTCLPLSVRDANERTSVSFGGAGGAGDTIGAVGGLVGLDVIVFRRGGRIEGMVIADTGEEIQFKAKDGAVATYSYSDLNTRSIYRLLLAQTSRSDGPAEFKLATYAGDIGLYAQARRHFAFAVDADPALTGDVDVALAGLRQVASEHELEEARAAHAEGDSKAARKHLATLLKEFPDEPAADDAAGMLEEIELTARAREDARVAEERSAAVQSAIAPIEKRFRSMEDNNTKGLTTGRSQSTAVRYFNRAISDGDRIHRDVDRINKKQDQDPELITVASDYGSRTDVVLIDVHCNLASLYTVRTNYNSALQSVNAALAIDSQNSEAKQMRARIEMAAADDGWDYGYPILRAGYRAGRPVARPHGGVRLGYGGRRR